MGINKQIFADKLLSTSIPSNLPITDQQKRIEYRGILRARSLRTWDTAV